MSRPHYIDIPRMRKDYHYWARNKVDEIDFATKKTWMKGITRQILIKHFHIMYRFWKA